jgi:hypothetical protein
MKQLLVALALALMPATALAQGIDMTWRDCVGTGNETPFQSFNCTGNVNESYSLILQFKLSQPIPSFVAMAAYVDYQNTSGTPLSPFWRFEAGGCNNTGSVKGIAMSDDIRLLPNCAASFADAWDGDGTGGFEGIAAYGVDFRRPGNGFFVLVDARASGKPASRPAESRQVRPDHRDQHVQLVHLHLPGPRRAHQLEEAEVPVSLNGVETAEVPPRAAAGRRARDPTAVSRGGRIASRERASPDRTPAAGGASRGCRIRGRPSLDRAAPPG